MTQPTFFQKPSPTTLADVAALANAALADPARGSLEIRGLASLDEAGPRHLTFFDNLKYADLLATTNAGACLVSERFAARVPAHVAVLKAAQPFRAFVRVAREWHADALRPSSWVGNDGIAPSAIIDPTARLEDGVVVDPLAVIGPDVEIGAGTVIGAAAVIGRGVKIGRDCNVGAHTAIQAALIGNNVLIHPGCSIGQDGYGFVFFGPEGHLKVPQTGRVLIQNDVEVGAGTTIDRAHPECVEAPSGVGTHARVRVACSRRRAARRDQRERSQAVCDGSPHGVSYPFFELDFFGLAFFGLAFSGLAFFGLAFFGLAFFGLAFFGLAFFGLAAVGLAAVGLAFVEAAFCAAGLAAFFAFAGSEAMWSRASRSQDRRRARSSNSAWGRTSVEDITRPFSIGSNGLPPSAARAA